MIDLRILDKLRAVNIERLSPSALRWHTTLCTMMRSALLVELRQHSPGSRESLTRANRSRDLAEWGSHRSGVHSVPECNFSPSAATLAIIDKMEAVDVDRLSSMAWRWYVILNVLLRSAIRAETRNSNP